MHNFFKLTDLLLTLLIVFIMVLILVIFYFNRETLNLMGGL